MKQARVERFVRLVEREFERLVEPRQERSSLQPLLNVLVFALGSLLSGGTGWQSMELFAKARKRLFRKALDLRNGTPSADTFRRVFEALELEVFLTCLASWLRSFAASVDGQQYAMDGKSLHGTAPTGSPTVPIHLLHVFACDQNLLMALKPVPGAPGEIQGALALLAQLPLKGALVSSDANCCTQTVTERVVAGLGHYLLCIKGNRGPLLKLAKRLFAEAERKGWKDVPRHHSRNAGHGRDEERTVRVLELKEGELDGKWANARCIVQVERVRKERKSGKVERETSYYLTDLGPDVTRLAEAIRNHWKVESRLHHVLDVTFGEDDRRIRDDRSSINLAALSRLALAMLERSPEKLSLRKKREFAAQSDEYLLELFALGFP